jgi:hypothetical protein
MKICAEVCVKDEECCENEECRMWINYEEDLNCTEIAIKNNGRMNLKQVGLRMGISYVRVTQLEKQALRNLEKIKGIEKDIAILLEEDTIY